MGNLFSVHIVTHGNSNTRSVARKISQGCVGYFQWFVWSLEGIPNICGHIMNNFKSPVQTVARVTLSFLQGISLWEKDMDWWDYGIIYCYRFFYLCPMKSEMASAYFFISNQNPHPRRKYVGIYYNFDAVFYTIPCCIETITKHHRFATVQTFLTDSQRSVSIISRSCCRTRTEHTDTHTVYMVQNNYIVIKRYACVTVLLIAKGINFTTHPYELSYCVASSHPWYISLCNRSELTSYEYYHILVTFFSIQSMMYIMTKKCSYRYEKHNISLCVRYWWIIAFALNCGK